MFLGGDRASLCWKVWRATLNLLVKTLRSLLKFVGCNSHYSFRNYMSQQTVLDQDTPQPTFKLLLGIWSHLSSRRRLQLGMLLIVILASGVAELLSLGAVVPFMAVLSDPQRLWQQPLVQEFSINFGLTASNQLLLPATIFFALTAITAGVIRLLNQWLNGRLVAAIGSDLSCEAYRRTLFQPYSVHVQRNSAAVITAMTSEIGDTVAGINSLMRMITSAVVAVWLLIGLLVIDAPVAVGTATLFGAAYGALAITIRRQLRSNGQKIAETSRLRIKSLQEGLGAIRDVLLDGSQHTYLSIYQQADRPQRQLQAKNNFLSTFPRYALEAMGLVGIALLGGMLVVQRGSGAAVIPLLGTLALGAQRLLPALQQVYLGWSTMTGYNAAMHRVLRMLSQPLPKQSYFIQPLELLQSICLDNVYFSYAKDQKRVLC